MILYRLRKTTIKLTPIKTVKLFLIPLHNFNLILKLKTKTVFLHQNLHNDTRIKHCMEPFRRY